VAVVANEYDRRLAQATAQLEVLVRRLQSLSAPAWISRRNAVIGSLTRLVELDGLAEERSMPELPELASFALADAVAVVTGDLLLALVAAPNIDVLNHVLVELRAALDATR
jgi:hypothetical protein